MAGSSRIQMFILEIYSSRFEFKGGTKGKLSPFSGSSGFLTWMYVYSRAEDWPLVPTLLLFEDSPGD